MNDIYIVSSSGMYVGVLAYDDFARDPRDNSNLDPEEIDQAAAYYDNGDVWASSIYEYKPLPKLEPMLVFDADRLLSGMLDLIDYECEQYCSREEAFARLQDNLDCKDRS